MIIKTPVSLGELVDKISILHIKNLNIKAISNKSDMATLACKIEDENIFKNRNIVKVITDKELLKNNISKAKNFLREFFPNSGMKVYHHIGIYIYKVSILDKIVNLKQTQNEISQKLEQIRAIDNKISIDVILANSKPIGVDTYEEYLEIKKLMEYKN